MVVNIVSSLDSIKKLHTYQIQFEVGCETLYLITLLKMPWHVGNGPFPPIFSFLRLIKFVWSNQGIFCIKLHEIIANNFQLLQRKRKKLKELKKSTTTFSRIFNCCFWKIYIKSYLHSTYLNQSYTLSHHDQIWKQSAFHHRFSLWFIFHSKDF